MPQSLVTAFVLAEALSERVNRDLGTNRAAIFEAIRNGFGGAVDSQRYSINPCVDHALSQCSTGEANKPHSRAVHQWLPTFAIGRHPNAARKLVDESAGLEGA